MEPNFQRDPVAIGLLSFRKFVHMSTGRTNGTEEVSITHHGFVQNYAYLYNAT